MPKHARAQKWGGSVSAPIPAAIARRWRIAAGTPIVVEEHSSGVLIRPVGKSRRKLSDILRACKKKFPEGNPHGVVDFGGPVGKEIW